MFCNVHVLNRAGVGAQRPSIPMHTTALARLDVTPPLVP